MTAFVGKARVRFRNGRGRASLYIAAGISDVHVMSLYSTRLVWPAGDAQSAFCTSIGFMHGRGCTIQFGGSYNTIM